MPSSIIESRIRLAGVLVGVGLVIQMLTLLWIQPLAFVAFLVLGCPILAAGVLLFLYSLVSVG